MSSKNGAVLSTEIVPEVLINRENYEDWRFRLQTYLKAQGLWNIIIDNVPAGAFINEEWERKNATALHAIHISCGPHAFSVIKHIRHAKQAWDKLAISMTEPEPELEPEPEPEISQPIQVSNITAEDVLKYKELHDAILYYNQNETNRIIKENPDVVRAEITISRRTALHVAAMAGRLSILKMLVQNMSKEDMEKKDADGCTALAVAITSNATIGVAECMVQKNDQILGIKAYNMLPVAMAFRYGYKEMGRYLYSMTPNHYYLQTDIEDDNKQIPSEDGATILCNAIYMQSFDVALDLLSKCEDLAVTRDTHGRTPVFALANLHPSAFESELLLKFWQLYLYQWMDLLHKVLSKLRGPTSYLVKILGIKDVYDKELVRIQTSELLLYMYNRIKNLNYDEMDKLRVNDALFLAVERGNVGFVSDMLLAKPELAETLDSSNMNIFMRAIRFRQPKIFSLIYYLNLKSSATSFLYNHGNEMLYLAAKLGRNPGIPGAALQMQSELQWFQEVKSIVPPWALYDRKLDNMTPDELFSEQHKKLVIEGEKWMKETATSCTVVGALIVTIMFAAAFTVPGGNDSDSGFPIFLTKKLFMIFIISDSLSLISSTISVLMFMGILTSRYAEQDFLKSLPRKLVFGLSTLFFSIAFMMVAFGATLFIVLRDKYSWISIPVICLAIIPVTFFVFMQYRLLRDFFHSTFGGGIFGKKARISK